MYRVKDEALQLRGTWPNSDFTPKAFTIQEETGDFYITANGGWYYTLWQMYADGEYTGQLYTTDASESNRAFWAVGATWQEGG